MDDALLVRRFERLGDLPRDRQRFVDGIAPRAIRSASVGPSTSSITSACMPPIVFEAVDLRDVGMIQRREQSALRAEPREPLGIGGDGGSRTLIATSRSSFVSRAR